MIDFDFSFAHSSDYHGLIDYTKELTEALDTVDPLVYVKVIGQIEIAIVDHYPICVFGNGGSAAVAQHFCCDFNKGMRTDTDKVPLMVDLTSNVPLITAIANDEGYENIFRNQILHHDAKLFGESTVLAMSASGSSPNIIKALEDCPFMSIAMVGFDGGEVLKRKLAHTILHINYNNYGVVEDCFSIIMHSISQTLRKRYARDKTKLKL